MKSNDELEADGSLEALRQLISEAAHGLNNVLGGILGCLFAIRSRAAESTEDWEDLARAEALCRKGGDLARQLLSASRFRQGTDGSLGDVPVSEEAGATPLAGTRVLVAEDESDIARLICGVLEGAGCACIHVSTGLQALEKVRDCGRTLSLVILDQTLPELDGEEAFRLLSRLAPEVPILLVTARQDFARSHLCSAPVLAKPFSAEELLRGVTEAIAAVAPQRHAGDRTLRRS